MTALPLVLMTEEEVAAYGRSTDAGFGALETQRGLLPLVAMEVDAHVAGVIASIEVAQTFVNTTGAAIEATYIFPLPDRAAVHRFRMDVNGRVIEGVVDERGAARQQYDEAIAAGHRAAITEEERAGVFTLRVGNLMPGETATVKLSLVGPLPVDDGEVTFRFPLVVAPRYIPGANLEGDQAGLGARADTDLVPDASRISPPVLLPGCPNPVRLGLSVAIEDRALHDLASSLHAIVTGTNDARTVKVQPGERLDRDFILRWRIDEASPQLRSSLVCRDDADGKAGTFMLTLVPPSTATLAGKPRDVVFVIDRSGSMDGWKMVAARRAAARMIDTLTSRDRFCALAFDNTVEMIPSGGDASHGGSSQGVGGNPPAGGSRGAVARGDGRGAQLVPASDRNRFRAVEQLAKVDARGGTELAEPLRRAVDLLGDAYDDRERVIVLVTDGQVGNEDHILRELAPHLKKTRVFTLGIDQAVNAAFLKRLAGIGGGLCELVESEDRLDAVMAKVHRRIGTPIATELALAATGLDIDRASIAPAKLPDVYAGAPVVVLGRYRGAAPANAAIDIDGSSFGDKFHATIKLVGDTIERGSSTAGSMGAGSMGAGSTGAGSTGAGSTGAGSMGAGSMGTGSTGAGPERGHIAWAGASWARARIRDLEDRYAVGEHALEGDIIRVSKQFGVLSRFTAYLAVDRSEVVNAGGKVHQIVQAVEHPAGWERDAGRGGGAMHANMARSRSVGAASARMAPPPPMASPAPMAPMAPMAQGQAMGGMNGASDMGRAEAKAKKVAMPVAANMPAQPPAPLAPPAPPTTASPATGVIATPPMSGPSSPAKAPPQSVVQSVVSLLRGDKGRAKDEAEQAPAQPYLATLGALARDLETQAKNRADIGVIRLLRQRLLEWIEDVRSVGGHDDLASAVERHVQRLSAVLAVNGDVATEAVAVAAELAKLAAGGTPPKTSRAFWK